MKKSLLLAFALLFTVASVNAQRVLLDFETESQMHGQCFGDGTPDNQDCHSSIANPAMGGTNSSANVGTFIEPAAGETWMGTYFDIVNGGDINVADNSVFCADVWVPAGSGAPFTFKLEEKDGDVTVNELEGLRVMPSAEGEWVTVCDNLENYPGTIANRLVLFFNIDEVPAAATTYYFDNVQQGMPTSVGGLIQEKNLKIFPNPATNNLFFEANDAEPMTITVTDLAGREVIRHNSFIGNNIKVADLAEGLYIVTFLEESTGRFGSTKFAKN